MGADKDRYISRSFERSASGQGLSTRIGLFCANKSALAGVGAPGLSGIGLALMIGARIPRGVPISAQIWVIFLEAEWMGLRETKS